MAEGRDATKEELDKAFLQCIDDAKALITRAMSDDATPLVSPTAMIVMRRTPDLPPDAPIQFQPVAMAPGGAVKIGIFSPRTLTPPGLDLMPPDIFWRIMKVVAHATNAYATVTVMEAWVARPKTSEEAAKVPERIKDYEHREEALIVTGEREGEYRMCQALIQRHGDKFTINPWEDYIAEADGSFRLGGGVFRSIPANTRS